MQKIISVQKQPQKFLLVLVQHSNDKLKTSASIPPHCVRKQNTSESGELSKPIRDTVQGQGGSI